MEKKYKVGYTTGVFDLFHIGHLNILKKSKELCDYLIVGVSTDELVQEYKNKTPMIPFSERVAIVEAIKYVDKVVPQTSMDKFKAWEDLHFDVMFHGNDWKNSSLYNEMEEKFHSVGVSIEYFEYTKNTSSTKLQAAIAKLNEQND
ncbi:MAG: adenylyltransferase/cytidyltransferase family protein [Clostridia bacterium]|nr:adenylyltransferase/cytidyltransferase family protein [Clostridia bacterium]